MKKRKPKKVSSMEEARKKRGLTADPWRATGISIAYVPEPKNADVRPIRPKPPGSGK